MVLSTPCIWGRGRRAIWWSNMVWETQLWQKRKRSSMQQMGVGWLTLSQPRSDSRRYSAAFPVQFFSVKKPPGLLPDLRNNSIGIFIGKRPGLLLEFPVRAPKKFENIFYAGKSFEGGGGTSSPVPHPVDFKTHVHLWSQAWNFRPATVPSTFLFEHRCLGNEKNPQPILGILRHLGNIANIWETMIYLHSSKQLKEVIPRNIFGTQHKTQVSAMFPRFKNVLRNEETRVPGIDVRPDRAGRGGWKLLSVATPAEPCGEKHLSFFANFGRWKLLKFVEFFNRVSDRFSDLFSCFSNRFACQIKIVCGGNFVLQACRPKNYTADCLDNQTSSLDA